MTLLNDLCLPYLYIIKLFGSHIKYCHLEVDCHVTTLLYAWHLNVYFLILLQVFVEVMTNISVHVRIIKTFTAIHPTKFIPGSKNGQLVRQRYTIAVKNGRFGFEINEASEIHL